MSPSSKSSILGSIAQICLVTPSFHRTLSGSALGTGRFPIFHFTSQPVHLVMQPVRGPALMADFLEKNGGREGVQHVAFDMNELGMDERKALMKERGFEVAMEGEWLEKKGVCHFVVFDTEGRTGAVI
ncbi:hypothetical protein DPSP01_006176 [Paraphaeosphaeria sporulosa]|uniref:VOC domain-containing protein n=1 Tax=Paraphaeosphaeria sporulosa TaxID=1460663 RepID=A0A177BWN9_9PLEO|nr:uncharacterized protein CC84DRAFT_1222248 [Paraphaeosphaeria sporulosa]OAF99903.1 hypothetical protein CC84DRAFT_1222248 [Paraphaeosphaeria sporulosa]